jgi:hypothetical protein
MNVAQIYPGQGLSLSQLVFALNKELKRAAYSPSYATKRHQCRPGKRHADLLPSFTFDQVSQLDQDASVALATVREWRNSFVPINRIPLDILPLIPTHLPSNDRLRASFVCRRWRRTFVQCAELWSQLSLSMGEVYTKTFLERAKGSALDIIVSYEPPVSVMRLLSPHAEQIRRLSFVHNQLRDIQRFLEVNSGPLPLLHTLELFTLEENSPAGFGRMTYPSPLFFSNAVNLKAFRIHSSSMSSPPFNCFAFPNLVLFDLSASPLQRFSASRLLDFLETSPMLRTVHMKVTTEISLEGVPQDRVVTLPNVETLTLIVTDGRAGYGIAAHISCPSARFTSLSHRRESIGVIPEEIFPPPVLWNAIVHQYTRSPVEEVTLDVRTASIVTCKLTLRSADSTILELYSKVAGFDLLLGEVHHEVFLQATRTIRNHPRIANTKRLHIRHSVRSTETTEVSRIANEVGQLFKLIGSLDELTIHHCDLRPYLCPFLPGHDAEEPAVFPPTKKLTISHPPCLSDADEQCTTAMVGLARSQHALGTPFECVVIRNNALLVEAEEKLGPWVGRVEYCEEEECRSDSGLNFWQ